ncbi:MAG: tyrosine-type recombinase/integrase [Merismopedia sp. SIO2A8]|nr:tyrosine-type recombinase/integrase [Symploca sp. SIO2B6]NET47360.1 tyrosine-type recombinase/integrase [Merismopedia sp. SIO2A8]
MWLDGKSENTVDSYRRYANSFLTYLGKPLHLATLADLQGWRLTLSHGSDNSTKTATAVVRSLFAFAHKIGVLKINPAAFLSPVKAIDCLHERILSELEVQSMIANESDPRNCLILRLLYFGGLRVSELSLLKWKNLKRRGESGQISVCGKGKKARTILLRQDLWLDLMSFRSNCSINEPVFKSKKGGHLKRHQLWRIVSLAANRAGIQENVSPHWLRHAHASHSLERGAPIHLVQQTLGHESIATTSRYLHASPNDSSSLYLP